MSEQSSLSTWLTSPIAILLGAVMIAGSILYAGQGGGASILDPGNQPPEATPVAIENPDDLVQEDDPVMGSDSAPVTIVEFSDFQCPYCRSYWTDTHSKIKSEYVDTGKVRLVFRDYPLAFHDAAKPSALAGNCALEQGKFWEYHDTIFAEQAKKGQGTVAYGIPELKQWAQQIGLDSVKFDSCLDSAKYNDEVDQDMADGAKYGVSGTPSFFVNGMLMVGAQPFAAFKAVIDAALE